jgi:hypothetical protein
MKKLRSGTIIEVIVALLIGMIVLAMAMTIVVKTSKNYNAALRVKALFHMNNRIRQIEQKPVLHEDTLMVNGLKMYERVSEKEDRMGVLDVYIRCVTVDDRFLAEKRRLLEFESKISNNE